MGILCMRLPHFGFTSDHLHVNKEGHTNEKEARTSRRIRKQNKSVFPLQQSAVHVEKRKNKVLKRESFSPFFRTFLNDNHDCRGGALNISR